MFEAQTYDKVLRRFLSRAPDGIDLRQGSIFYDAVAGIAFKIAKYYADLEQVFEMVFLVTATGDYLTLKAEEYAVYRQAAATAKYRIKYDGELPELGTRFFCSGQYFVLAQDDAPRHLHRGGESRNGGERHSGRNLCCADRHAAEPHGLLHRRGARTGRRRRGRREPPKACTGEKSLDRQKMETSSITKRGARASPASAVRALFPLGGENTVKGILIDTEGGPASEAVVQRVQEYIDPGGTGLGEGQANIGAHFTATSATAKKGQHLFLRDTCKGEETSPASGAQRRRPSKLKSRASTSPRTTAKRPPCASARSATRFTASWECWTTQTSVSTARRQTSRPEKRRYLFWGGDSK